MSDSRSLPGPLRLVILMPVFSDWAIASLVCQKLDEQIASLDGVEARILLVDDGSPEAFKRWSALDLAHITCIDALVLRRNLGHQRAIAMGLCWIEEEMECDAVVVMDADGEDRPEDVRRLVNSFREHPECIIFAERRKRLEGLSFRAGYRAYRLVHKILTGVSVRAGNFSIIPRAALTRIVCMSELWNHYAGAIYRSKLVYTHIPADRGRRLGGRSHMNSVELVVHGLSGIATFYDVVATRILIASFVLMVSLVFALCVVLAIRFTTGRAIPGWATYTTGLLLILIVQFASAAFSLVFLLITTRQNRTFVPVRDYRVFVKRSERLWGASR